MTDNTILRPWMASTALLAVLTMLFALNVQAMVLKIDAIVDPVIWPPLPSGEVLPGPLVANDIAISLFFELDPDVPSWAHEPTTVGNSIQLTVRNHDWFSDPNAERGLTFWGRSPPLP